MMRQNKDKCFTPSLFDIDTIDVADVLRVPLGGDAELDVHPSIARCARQQAVDDMVMLRREMTHSEQLMFISFGSGSSGNCYYLSDGYDAVLIDAGVAPDVVARALLKYGLSLDNVRGIVVTHDHGDHIRYLYTLLRNNRHMRFYCTPRTLTGILRRHNISRRIRDYHHPVFKEFEFMLGSFAITPFEVSHDGTDNSGYFIVHGSQHVALATDLGLVTPRVEYYMSKANHVVIEANYDLEMLRNGSYPRHLKARIEACTGHLDNNATASFVGKVYTSNLRNVFLCHLSQDNNRPDIAENAVRQALVKAGAQTVGDASGSIEARKADVQLCVLPRVEPSRLFTLRATRS